MAAMETNKKPRLDPGTVTRGSGTSGSGTVSIGSTSDSGTTVTFDTGTITTGTVTIGGTSVTGTGTIGSGTVTSGTGTGIIGSGAVTIGSGTTVTFDTGTIGSNTVTIGGTSGSSTGNIGSSTVTSGTGTTVTFDTGTIGSNSGTGTGTSGSATSAPTVDWPFECLFKIGCVDPAFRLQMIDMLGNEDPRMVFRTVFVRGFGWDVSAETLRKTFEPYGHIVDCRVAAGNSLNPRCPGGVGLVVFETPESAFKATKNRHKVINNRLTHTQLPFPKRVCVTFDHPNYTPVYVRDVPENGGTVYQLRLMFKRFGQIAFGPFWLQLPRNHAIIILLTPEQAAKAIEEPRKIISGREVQCFIGFEAIFEAAKKELMDQVEAAYTTHGHDPLFKTGLYVNHVHPELDDDKLHSFLANFGEIVAGPIPFLPEIYCSWRFALIIYKTSEDAENALVEAQDKMFDGYPLQCQASPDDFIKMAMMDEVKWCLLMAKSEVQYRAEVFAEKKISYQRKMRNSGS